VQNPFRWIRGKVPGPGALEFAYQRAHFDPFVTAIGAGTATGQLQVHENNPLYVLHSVTTVDIGGTQSGQIVSQPLLTGGF
jgi:hypothetical protein